MSRERVSTAVLISGTGTTLQSLIDSAKDENFPARLDLVISNKSDVQGLERAEKACIQNLVISHRDYDDRLPFDMAIHQELKSRGIECVCLAGFMRILTEEFISLWRGRMLNIHPSLLPAFRGNRAQEQVLNSDVTIAGCTIHTVVPELDAGPIIAQGAVPRLPEDDLPTLTARVRHVEQLLYPLALRSFLGDPLELPVTEGVILSNNPQITFDSQAAKGGE